MEITSPLYFLFLTATAILYWFLPKPHRIALLLLASYGWYASLDLFYLPLLLGTTLVDFFVARELDRLPGNQPRRQQLLWLSLALNLGVLFFFKLLPLQAPLGVSFFTFHSLCYIFDVYYRKQAAESSLSRYALFVCFFPKLLAGPIERYRDFQEKVTNNSIHPWPLFLQGAGLAVFGLFLKLVIGDSLALLVAKVFDAPGGAHLLPGPQLLLGVYAYSAQIYADFLGYTLIARGAALTFGISLDVNFYQPYLATSPQDFWRRWHRSLSFWFRDYVYLPLGGNRVHWLRNLFLTMLLAGAWHGASPRFLAWGAYHAFFVAVGILLSRALAPRTARLGRSQQWALRLLAWFATFQMACLGWIFFRAASFLEATQFFAALFRWPPGAAPDTGDSRFLLYSAPLGCVELWGKNGPPWLGTGFARQAFLAITAGICLVAIFIFGESVATPFIYFQF